MIGKPGRPASLWKRLRGGSGIVERLIHQVNDFTIVVVDTTGHGGNAELAAPPAATPAGDTPGQEVRLSDCLDASRIELWPKALSKEEAIRRLVQLSFPHMPGIDFDVVLNTVLAREAQGSTFFGPDLGIPHARIPGLHAPIAAMGIALDGAFDPTSDTVVRLVVLLLAPPTADNTHLRLLARAVKIAQDRPTRNALLAAPTPQEAYATLRDWEST